MKKAFENNILYNLLSTFCTENRIKPHFTKNKSKQTRFTNFHITYFQILFYF